MKLSENLFSEVIVLEEIPVLEFWHFSANQDVWKCLSKTLLSRMVDIQKLILNDVTLTDDNVDEVVSCCVNVRYDMMIQNRVRSYNGNTFRECELEAIGKSCKSLLTSFWMLLRNRLQNESERTVKVMILKQLLISSENVDNIASCITSVEKVKINSIEMTKKQWVKFGIELNKSKKILQCLGMKYFGLSVFN